MVTQIDVGGREVPFKLEWTDWRWNCTDPPGESAFPLATVVAGKRYELYSDGTFAEVEN